MDTTAKLATERQVTLFVCNCCGHVAQAQAQKHYDHPSMRNRAPLIQVECKTAGCNNENWTYTWRQGDDNRQLTDLYTPVMMDAGQVARFIEAVDFTAQAS